MINAISNNNINFTGTRLYKVKIKKLLPDNTYQPVDAYFTQLTNSSPSDTKAISELAKQWNVPDYLHSIVDAFKHNSHDTYCIETLGKEPLSNRIKAVMSRINLRKYNEGNDMLATYITADPSIQVGINRGNRKFKGVGEVSIYGTVRQAIDNGLDRLLIMAENGKFFDSIGITKTVYEDGEDYRYLPKKDFNDFLKNIEKKYKFTDINK